jgi:aminopeptidase N
MKHDRDSFVRYEATQNFAVETLEEIIQTGNINQKFLKAFGYLLKLDIELSYKALLLELPTISTLMQRVKVIDFEPLYLAKKKLSKELAQIYKDELLEIYHNNHFAKNKEIDAVSIGQRAIKNRCLKLLSALESEDIISLAKEQYENSLTMTDRVVALDILENTDAKLSEIALNHFYEKYKDNTLVMNKYFSILASSGREGVLDRVMALQNDDVYDEKVPNLVRSLIGVFARNYKYFHAKDGYGYRFIADKILDIDKINPQMASGLAGAFKLYEKMNKTNKKLIKIELERIISNKELSKNVYEIISKILK